MEPSRNLTGRMLKGRAVDSKTLGEGSRVSAAAGPRGAVSPLPRKSCLMMLPRSLCHSRAFFFGKHFIDHWQNNPRRQTAGPLHCRAKPGIGHTGSHAAKYGAAGRNKGRGAMPRGH
jgi:hypothetical protein